MKINKIAMNTLSILIGVIVILAIAGVAYFFRSELQDDRNMIEESVQKKHSVETENNVVDVNNAVSDVETKKIQGLKLTPTMAEGDSLQTIETIENVPLADDKAQETTAKITVSINENIEEVETIGVISDQQPQPIEETTTTTVLEDDKKELQGEKEVTPSIDKMSIADKSVGEKIIGDNTETEVIASDIKAENQLVNKTESPESEVTQTDKQQAQETVKTTAIDNPVDDVAETKKEEAEQIVIKENKPKDELSRSDSIDSDQSDSIKAAIQRQIKQSKQVLKLLTDHQER